MSSSPIYIRLKAFELTCTCIQYPKVEYQYCDHRVTNQLLSAVNHQAYIYTRVVFLVWLALLVVPEVLVDCLPQLGEPESLRGPRLGVDGVRPFRCVHLYGILVACQHKGRGRGRSRRERVNLKIKCIHVHVYNIIRVINEELLGIHIVLQAP